MTTSRGVVMTVTHLGLNADELAALLWDGIEAASTAEDPGDYGARQAFEIVPQGLTYEFTQKEIRQYVYKALLYYGRRSVECGSNSEAWNASVADWCAAQVKRKFGI